MVDLEGVPHCKDKIPIFRNKYSQKKEYQGHSPNFHISTGEGGGGGGVDVHEFQKLRSPLHSSLFFLSVNDGKQSFAIRVVET